MSDSERYRSLRKSGIVRELQICRGKSGIGEVRETSSKVVVKIAVETWSCGGIKNLSVKGQEVVKLQNNQGKL